MENERLHRMEETTRIMVMAILSLGLLAGGLVLLTSKIAGWSIIFGLPMVVIGVIFLVYSYDECVSGKFKHDTDSNT